MLRQRHVKMAARFVAHRLRELHPFEVQAMLLNACNLRCVYCRCPEIRTTVMTTEQWRSAIRGLASHGMLRIKFQGGEPTLRRDFRELCAESQANGVLTAVISNGIAIASHPELLDHLDEVVVSLDAATPEVNDRLRGSGCHHAVSTTLDHARKRGIPTYVNMVVSRDNLDELEPMLAFCEARGVQLNAQPVLFNVHFFDGAAQRLQLTPEESRAMHRRLAEWKQQGRGILLSAGVYQKAADWPDYELPTVPSAGESGCMAGKFYVHIDPNGDVHPCVQHGATLTPKNIVRDGLEAALRNAQRHNCGDCFLPYLNERKEVFSFRPAAVLGVIRRS